MALMRLRDVSIVIMRTYIIGLRGYLAAYKNRLMQFYTDGHVSCRSSGPRTIIVLLLFYSENKKLFSSDYEYFL